MRHDFSHTEAMCWRNVLGLQGLKDIRAAGTQTIAGQARYIWDSLACDERFDHGTSLLPVQVRHHDTQTHTGIYGQFVQPVLIPSEHAAELLPVPGNMTQAAQVRLGNEGGPQQPGSGQ